MPFLKEGGDSVEVAFRLEPSGLIFENPLQISILIPADAPSVPPDFDFLYFMLIQADEESPQLVEDLVVETSAEIGTIVTGKISHFKVDPIIKTAQG